MPDIRIRVGAAADTSLRTVFRPLEDSAKRAAKAVREELAGAAQRIGGPYRTSGRQAEDALENVGKGSKKLARITGASVEEIKKKFEELRRAAEKGLDLSHVAREAERELQRIERALARTQLGIGSGQPPAPRRGGGSPFSERMGYWSTRYFAQSLSTGARFAGDVARGMGVSFSLGELVQRGVKNETLATQIANSAWQPYSEDQDARRRRSPDDVLGKAKEVADYARMDRADVLQGMEAYVAKTGDLGTAEKGLKDFAKIAKATGSSMADLTDAAADVGQQFENIEDRGERARAALQVMMAVGGQGQVGAIEIKDLSSQMAKVASQAPRFQLDSSTRALMEQQGVTTDVGANIAIMGVLAQAARKSGGRPSAQQATQSAMAFVRDLQNGTQIRQLEAAGIDPFTDKDRRTLRDPRAILLEIFQKSRGDLSAITRMMPNQNSRAVVTAFAKDYADAYKTTPGTDAEKRKAALEAVDASFKKLANSTLRSDELEAKFGAALGTTASRAQDLQNKLEDVTQKLVTGLAPAFEKLAPYVIKAADGLAKLVTWTADHPGQAIAAALAASIARAGIENVLRSGIESLFRGGGAGGKGGGGLGNLGAALAITAAAVTITEVGMLTIDKVMKEKESGQKRQLAADINELNALSVLKAAKDGTWTGGTRADALKRGEDATLAMQNRIRDAESHVDEKGQPKFMEYYDPLHLWERLSDYVSGSSTPEKREQERRDGAKLDEMRKQLAEMKTVMSELKNGTQNVRIVGGMPQVDPRGQMPSVQK